MKEQQEDCLKICRQYYRICRVIFFVNLEFFKFKIWALFVIYGTYDQEWRGACCGFDGGSTGTKPVRELPLPGSPLPHPPTWTYWSLPSFDKTTFFCLAASLARLDLREPQQSQ